MGSKYGNVKTKVGGLTFDSAKEARRWSSLMLLQRAGRISKLERQTPYKLSANGIVIGKVIPDFRYVENGKLVVEDVKSKATITPMFRWKAKHLKAEHGIEVRIVL